MAKNDVEFSIGADNDPLKADIDQAEEIIDSGVDEMIDALERVDGVRLNRGVEELETSTTEAGEAAENLAAEFIQVGTNIQDGINLAMGWANALMDAAKQAEEIYDWTIKQLEANTNITTELERQEILRKGFEQVAKERAERIGEGTPEQIKAEGERVYAERNRLQEQLTAAGERLSRFQARRDAAGQIGGIGDFFSAPRKEEEARATQGAKDAEEEQKQLRAQQAELTATLKTLAAQLSRAEAKRDKEAEKTAKNTGDTVKAINKLNTGMTQ